jgi:hypothetical protein
MLACSISNVHARSVGARPMSLDAAAAAAARARGGRRRRAARPPTLPRSAAADTPPAEAADPAAPAATPGAAPGAAAPGGKKSANMALSESLLSCGIAIIGDDTALNWAVCQVGRPPPPAQALPPAAAPRSGPCVGLERSRGASPPVGQSRGPAEGAGAHAAGAAPPPPLHRLAAPPGPLQADRLVPCVHREGALWHAQGRHDSGIDRARRAGGSRWVAPGWGGGNERGWPGRAGTGGGGQPAGGWRWGCRGAMQGFPARAHAPSPSPTARAPPALNPLPRPTSRVRGRNAARHARPAPLLRGDARRRRVAAA